MKKRSWELPESEVTDQSVYLNRREFVKGATLGSLLMGSGISLANNPTDINQHTFAWRYDEKGPGWLSE